MWSEVRTQFENPPEVFYKDVQVCVAGRIRLYKGKPEIVLRSKNQVLSAVKDEEVIDKNRRDVQGLYRHKDCQLTKAGRHPCARPLFYMLGRNGGTYSKSISLSLYKDFFLSFSSKFL